MAKSKVSYQCTECGTASPAPLGRCPRCNSWGTVEAVVAEPQLAKTGNGRHAQVITLESVAVQELERTGSGDVEVDRVLGGGWVPGSVLLLAGEPGIGKSTLLLQLAYNATKGERSTLYVAGEESAGQVRLRAQRLGIQLDTLLTRETDARVLADYLRTQQPQFVVVDSVQTLTATDDGVPGSVTQVRDSTALLVQAGKEAGSTLVLIGHVTKQGSIAGPKTIEHMVDATLQLESAAGYRVLRSLKNRFGAAGEMGVFEMTSTGMSPVDNPSQAFLVQRPLGVPGSVVAITLEGQRPLLLEVQALASKSPYSTPRRVVQGLDDRRIDVVLAVLERRLELPISALDIFVNVAGGLRVTDPGTDLGVALAVYSAVTNRVVSERTAAVGEIGLAGELRTVPQLERRLAEARRAGFTQLLTPQEPGSKSGGFSTLAQALQGAGINT